MSLLNVSYISYIVEFYVIFLELLQHLITATSSKSLMFVRFRAISAVSFGGSFLGFLIYLGCLASFFALLTLNLCLLMHPVLPSFLGNSNLS